MFRLAVFADEVSQDLEVAVRVAREFGRAGVEIRSVWNTQPQDLSAAQAAEIARILEAYGLQVCAIAAPFLKCNLGDEAAYCKHFDLLRSCIALGKRLGTNLVRGFTCWRTTDTPEVWQEVERLYRQALPLLECAGAVIGVENEYDTSAATAALTACFLARLNHPRVRGIWDTANEFFAEGGERPFPEGYLRMKPFLAHVHVKDAHRDAQGQPQVALVGEGEIDLRGQLQALSADGYQGWGSLETHWRQIQLPADLLARPGGEACSEAGEAASRCCLAALRAMLPAA